ncbi:hypothetical protein [Streptomyces werraensis]|uniref:hypothetical protein n=1 Tax=Streptomyces werraensis TaxID=68284 RepID=UPI0037F19DDD
MTDRRPLGTGPDPAAASRTPDTEPSAPRAQLAAERLTAAPAAEPTPLSATGRRTLGTGPTPARPDRPDAADRDQQASHGDACS